MTGRTVVSLCSGIGAMDLGLERAGWTIAGQVEIEPWCRTVLARHWPEVPRWNDLTEVDPDAIARTVGPVDLVAGGPPCQPISSAGRGLVDADPRWLWPHVGRLLGALRPRWVLLENPAALLARGRGFDLVLGTLAQAGFDAQWRCLRASDVGAPHQRDRVWIVAYPNGRGGHGLSERLDEEGVAADAGQRGQGAMADADGLEPERAREPRIVGGPETAQPRQGLQRQRAGDAARRRGPALADADGDRPQGVIADRTAARTALRGDPSLAHSAGPRRAEGRPELPGRLREPASRRGSQPVGNAEILRRGRPGLGEGQPGRPPEPRRPGAVGAESVLGRVLDGLAAGMDHHDWPAPPGQPQHPWEPPRTVQPREVPDRGRRVQACGNALLPQLAELIGRALLAADHARGAA